MTEHGQEPSKATVKDTRAWFNAWMAAVEPKLADLQRAIEDELGSQP